MRRCGRLCIMGKRGKRAPRRTRPKRQPREPQTFTVDDPIFKTEPLFVIGCDHAGMAAYLKKRFGVTVTSEGPEENYAGSMLTFGCAPWRVVWIRERSRAGLAVGLHEVFHLVTRICADKGIPIVAHIPGGENGDEAAAYMFEYFARGLLKHWGLPWVPEEE